MAAERVVVGGWDFDLLNREHTGLHNTHSKDCKHPYNFVLWNSMGKYPDQYDMPIHPQERSAE